MLSKHAEVLASTQGILDQAVERGAIRGRQLSLGPEVESSLTMKRAERRSRGLPVREPDKLAR